MPKIKSREQAAASSTNYMLCECCEPKQNLYPRPDLGGTTDGKAQIAICIMHDPQTVYIWSAEDNKYVLREDLELKENRIFVKESGEVFVSPVAPPTISALEQEDEGSQNHDDPTGAPDTGSSHPQRRHDVNLDDDGFYSK